MYRPMSYLKMIVVAFGLVVMTFGLWVFEDRPEMRVNLPELKLWAVWLSRGWLPAWLVFMLIGLMVAVFAMYWPIKSQTKGIGKGSSEVVH